MGVLATRENYLNSTQLGMILDHQRLNGGLFGNIAIELELMSKKDVTNLLDLQKKKRNLLEIYLSYTELSVGMIWKMS